MTKGLPSEPVIRDYQEGTRDKGTLLETGGHAFWGILTGQVDKLKTELNKVSNNLLDKLNDKDRIIDDLLDKLNEYSAKEKDVSNAKALEINECNMELKKMGCDNYHFFEETLNEVLEAIKLNKIIGEINISEKIKDGSFRFYTKDHPRLSLNISHTYSSMSKSCDKEKTDFILQGRKKRIEKADDYANHIHGIINEVFVEVKSKKKIKSFRDAAKILNEKKIPTPQNGKWEAKTLTQLNKRWETLGLEPFSPKS